MRRKNHTLTAALIRRYADYLREQERSTATIQKYTHDLTARLADILGHSSVNTTRIYTMESGAVHARQMGRMGLVMT